MTETERHMSVEKPRADDVFLDSHEAMDAVFGIALVGEVEGYARGFATECWRMLDRLEEELSRFVPYSDISRINRLDRGERVTVGPAAFECLVTARRLYTETYGAFDVTMGTGPLNRSGGPNAPESSRPPRPFPLELDESNHTAGLTEDGVTVDLGGIGKGFALDRLRRLLEEWSIEDAILHSSESTILPCGVPPDSRKRWSVTLRHPDSGETLARLYLGGRAGSGSGAERVGPHIVDPRTGEYELPRRGAWALAPHATTADALSTAFTVMSRDEVEAFCEDHPDVTALLQSDNGLVVRGRECDLEVL